MSDAMVEFIGDLVSLAATTILLLPFAWFFLLAWGAFAPTFGWPALDYWQAFALLFATRLVTPPRVLMVRGQR